MLFSYLAHQRACNDKQRERAERIASLPAVYQPALSALDKDILTRPISTIVSSVQSNALNPSEVLVTYAKRALQAHAQTNCLTEIMIAPAETWARDANRTGPLAGVPVSLKDMLAVKGYDACMGYSAMTGQPKSYDGAFVRLLRDAGAVPFVKTNIPTTMLSFEATNDVFGRTENPHKMGYSPGGSSGGESALLALGGSRIGVGTDVAGSVRAPSHYSGVYAIKSSMFRFIRTGSSTTIPGQEGVPATHSPMAKTLEDLETFWRAVFQMKPWEYDHSVLNIPWKEVKFPVDRPLSEVVTDVLQKDGHEIVTLNSPSPYEGLQIASQLLLADGGRVAAKPFRMFETNDAGMVPAFRALRLSRFIMKVYAWYLRYSVPEYYALIAKREDYRARWFKVWRDNEVEGGLGDQGVDFVLTVPNALPAVPHRGMRHGWKACGYTFLFNLLDYSAGVMPITHVQKTDVVPRTFRARNAIERENFRMYDATAMEGLPVGVQVVGKRLDEERVLEGMKLIEKLMKGAGLAYAGIPL
ncbi:amidase signature enzyme [Chiua virens]|nr:amidase signature enzyme [Chiua virens]